MRILILFAASFVALHGAAPTIKSLIISPGAMKLEIVFSGALVFDETQAQPSKITNNCKITAPIAQEDALGVLADGFEDRITIPLHDPMPAGTKVEVLCESVAYFEKAGDATPKTAKNLKFSYTIPTAKDLETFMLAEYNKQVKAAKKTAEDIFASGFVTTSSTGAAGGDGCFCSVHSGRCLAGK